MKLFASPTSPFARKARIVRHEHRLEDRVDMVWTSPFEDTDASRALRHANPLNKVPVLVLPDGRSVFDSRPICELLDGMGQFPFSLTSDITQRACEQTAMALADGILDAAFNLVMELRRPVEQRSEAWIARWSVNIAAALDRIAWNQPIRMNLATIGLFCAVDYLDFRLRGMNFLSQEALDWRDSVAMRESCARTCPRTA